jgi:hypothetical protein
VKIVTREDIPMYLVQRIGKNVKSANVDIFPLPWVRFSVHRVYQVVLPRILVKHCVRNVLQASSRRTRVPYCQTISEVYTLAMAVWLDTTHTKIPQQNVSNALRDNGHKMSLLSAVTVQAGSTVLMVEVV